MSGGQSTSGRGLSTSPVPSASRQQPSDASTPSLDPAAPACEHAPIALALTSSGFSSQLPVACTAGSSNVAPAAQRKVNVPGRRFA